MCVVGDPAQTIYSFAGASSTYLQDFPKLHPDATSVQLVRNYRSTPEVIAAANTLLSGSASQGVELRSQRESGPKVDYTSYADEVAEANGVATAIAALRSQGVPPGEMAILFRINAQSEALEEALSSRGIPYVLRGAARFFDRPEIRQAITLLRGAARGDATDDTLNNQVIAILAGMGWTSEAPQSRGQARDRWESLQALVDQAASFSGSLGDFIAELERRASEQHAPMADGVTLATFHAAKGLEWDAVFLCGLQDGTLPITYAESLGEIEEERRLLYVGVTRARQHLSLSWALARTPGGRASRKPSRFLSPLLPATEVTGEGTSRGKRRRGAAHCRQCGSALSTAAEKKVGRCSSCPASYDEELFERLRAWRLQRAAEESVPAFVIFTDATLQLVAEHRPTSETELLRINGIGKSKVEKYSADMLALLSSD